MSRYTTELRYICETANGLTESVGFKDTESIIKGALSSIFDFDYPIFDEAYREGLETKIVRHFYTREIGSETVGLWKLRLCAKLNEIMPYYNQLYKSELLEFNPLYTTDVKRDGTRNNKNTRNLKTDGNGNVNGNATTYDLSSDTPQGAIEGLDDGKYLTNANKNYGNNHTDNETHSTNSGTVIDNGDYFEHVYGFEGANASEQLLKFRKTFLNIDMKIISELDVLFMQLW